MDKIEKNCEIKLAVIASIITFISVIAGSYLTNSLNDRSWSNQWIIEQHNYIIK